MIVLGVNFGHDSSVTIIRDGKVVFAIEEEKISRIKQDFGWPSLSIKEGLMQTALTHEDIDVVAIGGFIYRDISANEIKYSFFKDQKYKILEYIERVLSYIGVTLDRFRDANKKIFEQVIRDKGFIRAKLIFYNHHLCHAAGAFFCSPFTPDIVITCDGHGDGESFNFYLHDSSIGLRAVKINNYKSSIGAFYSAITQMLGFRPTRHEGKITGLAAYGKSTNLVNNFLNLFRLHTTQNIERFPFDEVDRYWDYYQLDSKLKLARLINLFTSESEIGVDYAKRYEILLMKIKELSIGYSKEDIAYAAQKVAETVIITEVRNALKQFFTDKSVNLGLSGGVFANVRINQMIYEMPEVDNIFVQPAMGDSGLSIGAAILADIEFGKGEKNIAQYSFQHTYYGPDYANQLKMFFENIKNDVIVEKLENPAKKIALLLKDNYVIGFWHGNMEWGPRALGKRSMILNTFDREVNESVNKRLNRTEFMPFAPSVLDFMMKTYMPAYDDNCPAGEYMTMTYDVDPKYHDILQAVVHVDGTARPQVVKKDTNPFFYEIINEFFQITGCGAIVNTSFNAHEEPIVSTPFSAYKALKDGCIDVLILEDFLVMMKN